MVTRPGFRFVLVGILLLPLATLTGVAEQTEPDPGALAKSAVVACSANLQSFSAYTCTYRRTKAQASSVENALLGRYVNALSFDCRLVVDGENDLYEALAPPVPIDVKRGIPAPGKKGLLLVPDDVDSDRYVSDGKQELNYCPQMQSASFYLNSKSALGLGYTPLGMMSANHRGRRFGPEFMLSHPEAYELSGEAREEHDGQETVAVTFRERTSNVSRRYCFAPAKGYLPIRVTVHAEKRLVDDIYVTAVRECSKQRWFPERTVRVTTPDRGSLYDVTEIALLTLDADNRPDRSVFKVMLPPGTLICDHTDARKYFRVKQEESITLDNLPAIGEMLDKRPTSPLADIAIPRTARNPWYRWGSAAAGLLLVCAGAWWLIRRRRSRISDPTSSA